MNLWNGNLIPTLKAMNKAETKKKIRELVVYLIDTNDRDVINHYSDMLWGLAEQYAQQVSIEFANWYLPDDMKKETEKLFNEWINQTSKQ